MSRYESRSLMCFEFRRRNLSNGFSEKAVREQEPILNHYVNLLVERLRAKSGGENLDIAHWYHLFTFDIVGDLTFGDSFHGLEKSVLHASLSEKHFNLSWLI